ncbi:MAG: carboxypeptidase-like regulatory domain-containing protein, partial [Candidatus Thermoplasmatota archaeon]|nr:carboxypeptidase-like regulatory domain-containing protein [Candidatus Thermoplasmatota archaeon]
MRDIAGSGGSAVSLKALLLMMFVVAMLFPVGPAAGETRISVNVYGNVTGPGGIPIVGAEVRVGSTDGSWNDGGYTNDTGYYKIYLPRPGAYRLEFLKDGYLNNFTGLDVPSYGGYVVSPEMAPLPVESETLNIGLFYLTRTSAVGKEVTATYHEGSHRYQYSGVTNASGSVSWDVFPADYKIEITEGGLLLAEEEIVVEEGVGTHQMDIGISELPPKDSLVKGYVRNSTGPMEDTVVAVMDPVTEITNFTETDEEGYFELGFWEGRHFLISMAETYESYFKSFELGAAETVWMNITMKEEKYSIHGDVRGPSGEFLKNISVQYFSENTFPEDNSDITNTKGEFGFKVAEGTGFLVISDGDPFEPGEFDVYFKRLNVSSNQTLRINMTGMDRFSLQTDLHFGNWSSFSSISKFFFPENNTMAIKAMVDLMVGDGDNYVTSDEIDAWYEFLTSEDQEIEEGPFGINTEENLTMDGRSFELIGERADISFLNFMGRVESPVKGIIQMDADYECDPFDAPFISHTLRTNISYSKENEDASLRLYYPPPAHLKDVEGTLHNVELPDVYPPQVTIIPVTDPDDDDDVDSEWVDLNLYNYTLEAVLRFNKDHSYVGEEEHFEVNITRDPLPNNTYSFGWTISIAGNDSNMTDVHSVVTEVPCIDHIFLGPVEYRVKVEITDGVGRRIWMHLGLNVYSEVP